MKLMKHRGKKPAAAPVSHGWEPSWPLSRLQSQIDQLFNESFDWFGPLAAPFEAWGPAVDVFEDKDQVVVKAELPGMKKEDIEIYMSGDSLSISGERKEESEKKSGNNITAERHFGRFHRWVPLPAGVIPEKIEAHYKDGVLKITCPKTEDAKRKQLEIKIT